MNREMSVATWWEASPPSPTIHIQWFACAVALAATVLWWRSHSRKRARSARGGRCDDPTCLRCHASSRRHVAAFRANARALRRLAKLEPALFAGTRREIWSAIEDLELAFELEDTHFHPVGTLRRWWKRWRETRRDAAMQARARNATSGPVSPLSPQPGQNPSVFLLPGLTAIPWHRPPPRCGRKECHETCPSARLWKTIPPDKKSPPILRTGDVEALQRGYPVIRREFLEFVSSDQPFKPFDPDVYTHADPANGVGSGTQPEWSSIYLYHQGRRQVETCDKHFPHTARILETQCPHLMAGCGFGSVYFSKLENNTKIKEHCGPTNVRWRCHLPLVVPKSTHSRLRVGVPGVNEASSGWEEGVPLLFDDSFPHSAVHRGVRGANEDASGAAKTADRGGARTVLIVDFWHPELSAPDRTSLSVLYPPGS